MYEHRLLLRFARVREAPKLGDEHLFRLGFPVQPETRVGQSRVHDLKVLSYPRSSAASLRSTGVRFVDDD
jgi:hypothetical protein